MRREARLASKRKWKKENAEKEKEKSQNQKEKYKKYFRDRYFDLKKVKESKAGETFEKLYLSVYVKAKSTFWDTLYDEAYEKVYDDAYKQTEDEEDDEKLFEKIQELSKEWIRKQQSGIKFECLEKGERQAFRKHFNDFKTEHFSVIQDKAMNEAFTLLLSEDDEKFEEDNWVEWKVEQCYRSSFKDELEKFENSEFFEMLVSMVLKLMSEANKKLNKAK